MEKMILGKQQLVFTELEKAGELIFACGKQGIVVNLVGEFKVCKNHHSEDQLNVDSGKSHVHIDWSRVKRYEVGLSNEEEVLTFFDGDEILFRLYKAQGSYSDLIHQMAGSLIGNEASKGDSNANA